MTQNSLLPQKQWQVELFLSKDQSIPHMFYGRSLVELRDQVYAWLLTDHPSYVRSRGIAEKEGNIWAPLFTDSDQQAYRDFCDQSLCIQKGPEYEQRGFIDGQFQFEYVQKIATDDHITTVNQMLQRGWHLLSLETSEETGATWYILGHTEHDAF